MKKPIIVIALIIVLAIVGFVAADEAGIITVNIANSPNSQLVTNVSNSTIQGETNFTDTQAVENITLTNSTLTLNVNGQNVTISSQNGNIVISTQGQNVTLTSSPVPSTIVPLNITTAPSWLFLQQSLDLTNLAEQ